MGWQVWNQVGPKKVSDNVRRALVSQFRVASQAVDQMRVLRKSGRVVRRRVNLIRIFDPSLLENALAGDLKYDDFETVDHLKALLFNGHIEASGGVYLTPST